MSVTQRAPRGGKSCPCEGASQVVVGIAVTTRKMRASEPENTFDPCGRGYLREQVPSDPQIDNAPVGLRKALGDAPSLHTITVDLVGLRRGDAGEGSTLRGRRCEYASGL